MTTDSRGSLLMLLNLRLAACRSVLFIVLIPLSAVLLRASRCSKKVMARIMSAVEEVAELMFRVSSSKGFNTVTVFSNNSHSFADRVAGRF